MFCDQPNVYIRYNTYPFETLILGMAISLGNIYVAITSDQAYVYIRLNTNLSDLYQNAELQRYILGSQLTFIHKSIKRIKKNLPIIKSITIWGGNINVSSSLRGV